MAWHSTSRQSRGYGADWDKTRLRILKRDKYLCQCSHCKESERVTPATEVDHVVSKANAKAMRWTAAQIESDDNLQAINTDCHKRKTAEELGRTLKKKVKVGLDGFPVR